MNSLSTFIRYNLLTGAIFLVPLTSCNQITVSGSDEEASEKAYVRELLFKMKSFHDELKSERTNDDYESEVAEAENKFYLFNADKEDDRLPIKAEFWTTVYSIESKQGKLLYRPSNKNRNCDTTASPCGHHQLSLQALKDISCITSQCKRDREDFAKSLAMSKKLQAVNDKRLKKAGYINLPDYQKYLIHQQGASGLKTILASSKGKKLLSRNLKKNMAGNSPFSYKTLKRMGSKLAAKKFLKHWEKKWKEENKTIASTQLTQTPVAVANIKNSKVAENPSTKTIRIPLFNYYELQIALNLKI